MDSFRSVLPSEIADLIIAGIKNALVETYEQNSARHEPALGDDEQTFGFACYRNSWFKLEQVFETVPGVKTSRPKNSLVIRVADLSIHVYRGGPNELCNIDEFDFTDGSFTKEAILAANQQVLDFQTPEPLEGSFEAHMRSLTIVHFGNPDDGLCSIWAGAALPKPAGMSPWEWREELFVISREDDGLKAEVAPSVTPFSDGAEPEVTIERRQPQSDNEEAEPNLG